MHNLYAALTSTDLAENGVKNLNIFYDTSFLNLKVTDNDTLENFEYLVIQKLDFNYAENLMDTEQQTIVMSFGNTGYAESYYSNGNCLVKNLFLEDKKKVLVCGMADGLPTIFRYDLNEHSIKEIYPAQNNELSGIVTGTVVYDQRPIASFNYENDTINFVYTTTLSGVECVNNIKMAYSDTPYVITVSQLTGYNLPELIDVKYVDGDALYITKDNNKFLPFTA